MHAGVQCASYHAGMKGAARAKVLTDWTAGRVRCVAATVAFGMGIDRAAVRLVVHYNLPKTLEGFYQVSIAPDVFRKCVGHVLASARRDGSLSMPVLSKRSFTARPQPQNQFQVLGLRVWSAKQNRLTLNPKP